MAIIIHCATRIQTNKTEIISKAKPKTTKPTYKGYEREKETDKT